MNILILGSGGREHAFAWKINQSNQCSKLYIAPGNAGTSAVAENIALSLNDFDGIANFVKEKGIKLLIVGPEAPLVDGLRDYLSKEAGLEELLIVGPDKAGAELEGSKDFAKALMKKTGQSDFEHAIASIATTPADA